MPRARPRTQPSFGCFTDGSAVVSYGEFARVEDHVVVSMPVGGRMDSPRLHVVALPAAVVDWDRTDRYTVSVRYQHYATTRGEADFIQLSTEVAGLLSDIALNTDRRRVLTVAEQARRTLADWPRTHFGYRQQDVAEIVALLDEAIFGPPCLARNQFVRFVTATIDPARRARTNARDPSLRNKWTRSSAWLRSWSDPPSGLR